MKSPALAHSGENTTQFPRDPWSGTHGSNWPITSAVLASWDQLTNKPFVFKLFPQSLLFILNSEKKNKMRRIIAYLRR